MTKLSPDGETALVDNLIALTAAFVDSASIFKSCTDTFIECSLSSTHYIKKIAGFNYLIQMKVAVKPQTNSSFIVVDKKYLQVDIFHWKTQVTFIITAILRKVKRQVELKETS